MKRSGKPSIVTVAPKFASKFLNERRKTKV